MTNWKPRYIVGERVRVVEDGSTSASGYAKEHGRIVGYAIESGVYFVWLWAINRRVKIAGRHLVAEPLGEET